MMTIEEKLRSLWRQERRFYHVRGASRFILWLIAMLAVDFIIDWGILFRVNSDINIGLLMLIVNLGVPAGERVAVLGGVTRHRRVFVDAQVGRFAR